MSVVNQMLQDLDRRQTDGQPVYAQHVQPAGASRYKLVIVVTLVFVAALAASYGALRFFDAAEERDTLAATPVLKLTKTDAPQAPAEPIAPQPSVVASVPPTIVEDGVRDAAPSEAVVQATRALDVVTQPVMESAHIVAMQAPAAAPIIVESSPPAAFMTSEPVEPFEAEMPAAPMVRNPGPTKIDVRPYAPEPTADGEYRRAAALINQGRSQEARTALQRALEFEPAHEAARQTLAVLLIEANRNADAETLLAEGLRLNSAQSNFAIVLARLQLDRGDDANALQVLRTHATAAQSNAEYRAFTAALLQRLDRHAEAIEEYRAVVTLAPRAGLWWVGLGRSYEAADQAASAADAYARAYDTGNLSDGVAQFVEQKLQTLR